MKHLFFILISITLLTGCNNDNKVDDKPSENNTSTTQVEEQPIDLSAKGESEVIDNLYIEYYPGERKRIKFQGKQDVDKLRDGTWLHFSFEGVELSMTTYVHGKKEGPTMVKYPNGNIHYLGQYKNDKPFGIWTTYTIDGVSSDKDFGSGLE